MDSHGDMRSLVALRNVILLMLVARVLMVNFVKGVLTWHDKLIRRCPICREGSLVVFFTRDISPTSVGGFAWKYAWLGCVGKRNLAFEYCACVNSQFR